MKAFWDGFFQSRKLLYIVIAAIVLVVLAVTGTIEVSSDQVIEFLKWGLLIVIPAHAITDIASMFLPQKVGEDSPLLPRELPPAPDDES